MGKMAATATATTMVHDLLNDPLLSWRDSERRVHKATLPGILARLAAGELSDFPRLRAHQFEPWCMFLTQLAAIALHRGGVSDPRRSESGWRSLLTNLSTGAAEPWCLVAHDLSKSAFLQPSVPEGALDAWKRCESPDALDVLITAKNHDVKMAVVEPDDIEAWIAALVTLQTMEGYFGSGRYGIARMKGGFASRPRVGLAPDRQLSGRFLRDTFVLLEAWQPLVERGFAEHGTALCWMVPWDGTTSLDMNELAPHFIEVCRRLRMVTAARGLAAAHTSSSVRRCLPNVENGDVGDVWIPVDREGKALCVGPRGFGYELMAKILFVGDFEPPAAQRLRAEDRDPMVLLASVMARGRGETEGLHDRAILIPGPVRRRLSLVDGRSRLAIRATLQVQQAQKMRSKVLYPSLKKIALGETTPRDAFDDRVDEVYFEHLFACIEQEDDSAQLSWDARLRHLAWSELQGAIGRCSVPSERWYRAVSNAELVFDRSINKHFPTLFDALKPGSPGGDDRAS